MEALGSSVTVVGRVLKSCLYNTGGVKWQAAAGCGVSTGCWIFLLAVLFTGWVTPKLGSVVSLKFCKLPSTL